MRSDNRAKSQVCWKLTNSRMKVIETFAAEGLSITAVAREMNVHQRTLRNAAEREFKAEWMDALFPPSTSRPTKKNRLFMSPEERKTLVHLAVTTPWRKHVLAQALKQSFNRNPGHQQKGAAA